MFTLFPRIEGRWGDESVKENTEVMLIGMVLQELEQEKYHLRRRLEVAEEEYDLKVAELQSDINNLRQMLEVRPPRLFDNNLEQVQ